MTNRNGTPRTYQNIALTVIAGLLALNTFGSGRNALLGSAHAQQGGPEPVESGMVSAAEQRKQMIAELKAQSVRLERIESALARGVNVKVTDMPPIVIPQDRERAK